MIRIFEKDGDFSVLTIDEEEDEDIVGHYDTKRKILMAKYYENPIDSSRDYANHTKVTKERGWKLVYSGERNFE